MLGWFLRLDSPIFVGAPRKDAFEFFTSCMKKLCNLGLDDFYGMKYTTFLFY